MAIKRVVGVTLAMFWLALIAHLSPVHAMNTKHERAEHVTGGSQAGSPILLVTDYWRHRSKHHKFRGYNRLKRFQDNWRHRYQRRSGHWSDRSDRANRRAERYLDQGRHGASGRAYRRSERYERRSNRWGERGAFEYRRNLKHHYRRHRSDGIILRLR